MGAEPALPASDRTAEILVVDDDAGLADLMSERVREKWTCKTVYSGDDAIPAITEGVDLVVLDRQMPRTDGEEILTEIREDDLAVQVLMVSAVPPDVDIVELPVDEYLQKPVERSTLQETIEQLLVRRTYHPTIENFLVCRGELGILEERLSAAELFENEQYLLLRSQAETLRQSADATLGQMTTHVAEFHDVEMDD